MAVDASVSVFEQTARLRELVSSEAHRTWSDPANQVALADFVIRIWGGLGRNSPETIRGYVKRFGALRAEPGSIGDHRSLHEKALHGKGLWKFDGIASWSKWVNFLWPGWALIYDARIAFGLNAIHFLEALQTPVFPQPPGRNSLLGNLDAEALAILRLGAAAGEMLPDKPGAAADWFKDRQFPKNLAYPIYLEVMQQAHELLWPREEPRRPLVHTEMLLFRVSANELAIEFGRAVVRKLRDGSRCDTSRRTPA